MKSKDITEAWATIRKENNSIPDDVLDFMKNSAISALAKSNTTPVLSAEEIKKINQFADKAEAIYQEWDAFNDENRSNLWHAIYLQLVSPQVTEPAQSDTPKQIGWETSTGSVISDNDYQFFSDYMKTFCKPFYGNGSQETVSQLSGEAGLIEWVETNFNAEYNILNGFKHMWSRKGRSGGIIYSAYDLVKEYNQLKSQS